MALNFKYVQSPQSDWSDHFPIMESLTTWLREQLFKPKDLREERLTMLSDSSDNEETHQLTVNEHFAKAYQHRKEREELQKRELTHCSCFAFLTGDRV
jgi:hypothetical protein